jgi:hypothetical protein
VRLYKALLTIGALFRQVERVWKSRRRFEMHIDLTDLLDLLASALPVEAEVRQSLLEEPGIEPRAGNLGTLGMIALRTPRFGSRTDSTQLATQSPLHAEPATMLRPRITAARR